jgi:predicted CXXCH cytochrome family protein
MRVFPHDKWGILRVPLAFSSVWIHEHRKLLDAMANVGKPTSERQQTMLKKIIVVVIVLLAIAAASATLATAQGNQPPGPTYIGSDKCAACHPAIYESWSASLHTKMILDPAKDSKAILAAFDKLSSVITDTKLLYKKTEVVLTLGWRYRQRYILADPKTGRLVMGAGQWNIPGQGPAASDAAWQPAAAGEDWLKECAGCHTTGFNLEKANKFTAANYKTGKGLPFVELGIGCEACHGPGSEHAVPGKSTQDNIPVNKSKALDAQICGQCHTRGASKDDKGETHQYPLGYTPGGDLSKANWTPVQPTGQDTDPNWWVDGHAKTHRQQYLEWQPSKHAAALDTLKKQGGQDSCVVCHSADAFLASQDKAAQPVKLADAKFSITCQTCHDPHKTSTQMFNELLRNESYKECTACHNGTSGGAHPIKAGDAVHEPMQEMYEGKGAVGVEGKASPHFTAKDGQAICVSCHMPGTAKSADTIATSNRDIATHDWKIVMPGKAEKGEPSACSACHLNDKANAPQFSADALQTVIDSRQKEMINELAALDARLKALSEKNTTWIDAKTQAPADTAPDSFKAAFTNISFVKADGSKGFHNYSYAKAILAKADSDLKTLDQPTATPTSVPPTPEPPTPTPEPLPTVAPTAAPAPQAAPGTNWLVWLGLAAIVIVVLVLVATRKPKAS